MFKNYLKTAVRVIWRDKTFSCLNVSGLALGMACFALSFLWVRDEVQWDRFHPASKSIYRLQYRVRNSGRIGLDLPGPLGPYLAASYPEVASAVRIYRYTVLVRHGGEDIVEKEFVFADASFLDIFKLDFLAGDPDTAFSGTDSAILTQSAAEKYFGHANPLGRVLDLKQPFPVRVTAVVKDPPANSDIQYKILVEFKNLSRLRKDFETEWGIVNYRTYIRLAPGVDAQAFGQKVENILAEKASSRLALDMKPLRRIHLYEDGAIRYVAIVSFVALFILIIAACNFINLTTARSSKRAKEIAVRKVVGAVRGQLVRQHLFESTFLSLCSLGAALSLAALFLPLFNAHMGKTFGLGVLADPRLWLALLGMAAAVGLLSGAYPALLLSSYQPFRSLKGRGSNGGRASGWGMIRKILLVSQFSISLILMISTLIIHRQIGFIRGYDLGIRRDNVICLPSPGLANRDAFVEELTKREGVIGVAYASTLPSKATQLSGVDWEGRDPGRKDSWQFISVDDRYLDVMEIDLLQGEDFERYQNVEADPRFIVNRKAVEEMGLPNPIGRRFSAYGASGTLIGVVDNFHFRPLHEDLAPLVLFIAPNEFLHVLVKVRPRSAGPQEILASLKDVWNKFAQGRRFTYQFLEDVIASNYRTELKMNAEFKTFSFLGIFISCLGLVGLVAYVVERKRKEIGIRRVLGAGLTSILSQIHKEFLWPILVANLIAWPVAYWGMSSWLRSFAFHTNIPIGLFLAAAAAALGLGQAAVIWQTVKAARRCPVDSLKYE